ncbi:uncharacterized protein V1513DRAFT_444029 [Lipomyces chichibuensis]|uniref:uncharacterized protein n=1 Tax=Lipomyces chichibuensis TaxID=1546026 RepID=UPI003343BE6A
MKFSALAIVATLASSALAATKQVYLKVKSDNPTIDGQGLSSIHEGAAINYVFLGSGSEELVYESSNSTIYDPYILPGYPFYLQIWGNIVIIGVGETVNQFEIDSSNYLTVNGSESGFYAAMNTNDPYNYSAFAYEAVYYPEAKDAPKGAIPFRIYAEDVTSSTSSVATTTSSIATTTSSIATTTSAKPSKTTAVYTNSSITATTTAKNSTATSTSPAQFTGAATVNQVSGALALGAVILAMLV